MNNIFGRILGVIIGGMLGGPLGAVVGFLIGYAFDAGKFEHWLGASSGRGEPRAEVQRVFFETTFSVMGHVAKADGRVTEREIVAAKKVMSRLGLDETARTRAIEAFNQGKTMDFDLDVALNALKKTCWYKPGLLRFFLETQIQIAYADSSVLSPHKQRILERICQHLGVSGFNFSQFEQQYRAQQNYQRYQYGAYGSGHHQYQQQASGISRLEEAYKILGVSQTVSDVELKKAYRKLMSENHPDRLMAKGVPQEMIKMATERTQQIQKAYEDICKSRGRKK